MPPMNLTLLKLYKVSIPFEQLPQNVEVDRVGRSLSGIIKISNIFGPLEQTDTTLSIIVRPPEDGITHRYQLQTYGQDNRTYRRDSTQDLITRYKNLVSQLYYGGCRTNKYSIHNGGFASEIFGAQTLPIQLFHPIFAEFMEDINANKTPPPDIVRNTADYIQGSSAVYQKQDVRQKDLTLLLDTILSTHIQFTKNDKTVPDGMIELRLEVGTVPILIKEDKNALGDGGPLAGPSTHWGLDFGRCWAQEKYRKIRDSTNCPTFILVTAGPWLAILGAVMTDIVVVRPLTDFIWLGFDCTLNTAQIARVAKIFSAVKTGLNNLKTFYDSLKMTNGIVPSRFYPSPSSYTRVTGANEGELVPFEYVRCLEDSTYCATFQGRTVTTPSCPSRDIVIKFSDRYGKEAHELLAENGLAPKLLYCGSPWPDRPTLNNQPESTLFMVVMEYVDGSTLHNMPLYPEGKDKIRQQLQKVLELLHTNDLVYGDLRPPNIMITGKAKEVKVIDFDWAGRAGEVQYPASLSTDIHWAEGVEPFSLITKNHDLGMLNKIFREAHPVYGT